MSNGFTTIRPWTEQDAEIFSAASRWALSHPRARAVQPICAWAVRTMSPLPLTTDEAYYVVVAAIQQLFAEAAYSSTSQAKRKLGIIKGLVEREPAMPRGLRLRVDSLVEQHIKMPDMARLWGKAEADYDAGARNAGDIDEVGLYE